MEKLIRKVAIFMLMVVLMNQVHPFKAAFAQDSTHTETINDQVRDKLKRKLKRGAYYLLGIEQKLEGANQELSLLKDNKRELQIKIDASEIRAEKLNEQLKNLDNLLILNTNKIAAAQLQKAVYENSISVLETDMKQKEKTIGYQVEQLEKTLTAYYVQTNTFFTANDQPALLALLASGQKTGDIIKETEYLYVLQNASQELIQTIQTQQTDLENQQHLVEEKKGRLADLEGLLANQQQELIDVQEAKKRLLKETQGKQAIYEALLDISKREVEQVSKEIQRMKENYAFFQSKLDTLNDAEVGSDYFEDDDIEVGGILKGSAPLSWPVSPANGLSALFHDSEYRKTLGVEHNAIDIRINEKTPIKATADGVVSKVAENGFAYSYVIIAHPDKLITLYGHLSEIFVEEGEIVKQGQTIALSGGTPGTKGAGWLTTGPHLHLEIWKNFQHVDPLEYLPLEFVPLASLPEKYLKKLTGEEQKIRREQ